MTDGGSCSARSDSMTVACALSLADAEGGGALWQAVHATAQRVLAARPTRRRDAVLSDALLRLASDDWALLRRSDPQAPLGAVLGNVIRFVRMERCRRARWHRLTDEIPSARSESTGRAAKRRELLAAVKRLPQPYRAIQMCRLRGWAPADLMALLTAWRPVGRHEVRRLTREANRMLRACLRGRDPDCSWPIRRAHERVWMAARPVRRPGQMAWRGSTQPR